MKNPMHCMNSGASRPRILELVLLLAGSFSLGLFSGTLPKKKHRSFIRYCGLSLFLSLAGTLLTCLILPARREAEHFVD